MTAVADDQSALDALEADATAPPEGVLVPLVTDDGTVDILVPPPYMWFEGAVEALTTNRTADWVDLALTPDQQVLWKATRKRYRDIDVFMTELMRRSGQNPGKSSASKPSSRSTRRR